MLRDNIRIHDCNTGVRYNNSRGPTAPRKGLNNGRISNCSAGKCTPPALKERVCPNRNGKRKMSESATYSTQQHWYALWVYRGLVMPVVEMCRRRNLQSYRPMRPAKRLEGDCVEYREECIMPNLMFIRTTAEDVAAMKSASKNRYLPYCYPGTNDPAPIDDRTMEIFMLVVKSGGERAECVELPIDKGDRVRVTGGIFRGAEGYIRRIHGSRRFVVAIEGVAAVAVTHIPRQFLEPATA